MVSWQALYQHFISLTIQNEYPYESAGSLESLALGKSRWCSGVFRYPKTVRRPSEFWFRPGDSFYYLLVVQ